jgi:hypothetical protein
MAVYIEAPNRITSWSPKDYSIFLGGGITNCADWQDVVVRELMPFEGLTIFNPRRKTYQYTKEAALEQITWEYIFLEMAASICFWFSPETLCPITLFEYGKYLPKGKKLFVGCHADYKRLLDVKTQTLLEKPHQVVHENFEDLLAEIVQHMQSKCGNNG